MAFTSSVDVFIQFVLEIRKQLKLVGKKELNALGQLWCMEASQTLIALQYQPVAPKQVENKLKKAVLLDPWSPNWR